MVAPGVTTDSNFTRSFGCGLGVSPPFFSIIAYVPHTFVAVASHGAVLNCSVKVLVFGVPVVVECAVTFNKGS